MTQPGKFDASDPEEISSVYPETPPAHDPMMSQIKSDFKAWHHPRKQYIRVAQWKAQICELLSITAFSDERTFNYLSLPGDELFDVRVIHDACREQDVKLKYVGFNSIGKNPSRASELNISRNEVQALPNIHEFSK